MKFIKLVVLKPVAKCYIAFGTKKIEKVDKIVGPGNAFVATAKKSIWKCRY